MEMICIGFLLGVVATLVMFGAGVCYANYKTKREIKMTKVYRLCSTCDHFPNDKHCIGCYWDDGAYGNTHWELKHDGNVIERRVIDEIKADIEAARYGLINDGLDVALAIIDKHTGQGEQNERRC